MSDMEKTVSEKTANETSATARTRRKTRIGRVVSDKMSKSIVVRSEAQKAHRYYGKITARSTRYMAHDEKNEAKVGDLVRITETRPMSARKRWRLVEILEKAK
jgi:small subunit ribosomal protein S17